MALSERLELILSADGTLAKKGLTDVANTAKTQMTAAQSAITKTGATVGNLGQGFGRFAGQLSQLNLGSTFGPLGSAIDQAAARLDNIGGRAKSSAEKITALGAVTAGLGAVLIGVAAGDERAQASLKTAIDNTGASAADFKGQIDAMISSQEHYGHTAEDSQSALEKLTIATGDTNKALGDMQLVADLAAQKHISLADAADMVSRIIGGKGARALAVYGITASKTGDAVKDAQVNLDALSGKLSGQASAAADTFAGHLAAIRADVTDGAASFGQKYGPAITAAGAAMTIFGAAGQGIAGILARHAASATAAAAGTEALAVSEVAATAPTGALATALGAVDIEAVTLNEATPALAASFALMGTSETGAAAASTGLAAGLAGVAVSIGAVLAAAALLAAEWKLVSWADGQATAAAKAHNEALVSSALPIDEQITKLQDLLQTQQKATGLTWDFSASNLAVGRVLSDNHKQIDDTKRRLKELQDQQQSENVTLADGTRLVGDAATAYKQQQETLKGVQAAASREATAAQGLAAAQMNEKSASWGIVDAQKAVTQARQDGQKAILDQQSAALALRDAEQSLQDIQNRGAKDQRGIANAQLDAKQAAFDLTDAQQKLADTLKDPKATAEDKAKAQLEVDRANLRVADSTDAVTEAQKKAAGRGEELSKAQIAVKQAQDGVKTAAQESQTAQENLSKAQDGVTTAYMNYVTARVATADLMATLDGRVLDSKDKLLLQKDALEQVAATLDPSSPLYTQLQGFIALLDQVDGRNVNVVLGIVSTFNNSNPDLAVQSGGINNKRMASGGRVQAGQGYLIGDKHGISNAEMFYPSVNGVIDPNIGKSGGDTIHIYENSSPRETARALSREKRKLAYLGSPR